MMNTKSDLMEFPKEIQVTPKSHKLEEEIIEHGESKELTKKLAECHFKEGNYLRALNLYLKILTYEPENARIWNKLAVTFIKLEEFDLATDMSRIAFRMINKKQEE